MTKYGFNEHWRARDQAHAKLPDALLDRFFTVVATLAEQLCPRKKGPGRPPKIGPKEAAFLAAVKEYHHQMPYRELAASRYVKWLDIAGVHYTAIQKAIDRLPKRLLDATMKTFAEMVSQRVTDCVADATCFRPQEI